MVEIMRLKRTKEKKIVKTKILTSDWKKILTVDFRSKVGLQL